MRVRQFARQVEAEVLVIGDDRVAETDRETARLLEGLHWTQAIDIKRIWYDITKQKYYEGLQKYYEALDRTIRAYFGKLNKK